jgi:hypothetical protein
VLENITIEEKIKKDSIYLPSDTNYFNDWTKLFVLSAKKYVPWINLHCHIFDMTYEDELWCKKYGLSYSSEKTPESLIDHDQKRGYWVNVRFYRIPEIFEDNVSVLALDVDGLVINTICEDEFKKDLNKDWVAIREKGSGSLGGCVGLTANGVARHIIRDKIFNNNVSEWFLDQQLFNRLINENILSTFNMKYVDYHFRKESKVWTGKGDRKFKKIKKDGFPELIEEYKKLLGEE